MRFLVLVLLLSISSSAFAGQDEKAIRKAAEAAAKHFELDKMAKKLEKKYINDDVRYYGGYAWIVADVVIQQRITYKWTF